MTGIGEKALAQPVKPPLRERCACLAKLVKNRLTLTTVEGDLPSSLAISLHEALRSSILWTVSRSCLVSLP